MQKNQSVRVGIRIRPLNKRELELDSPICVGNKDNVLSIQKQKDAKQFVFDYVFGINTQQQNIYESCAYGIVENALQGYNGTIFAYGQTGAGKTFTMVGNIEDTDFKGIIPRAFDHVISAIQTVQTSEQKRYVIRASYIEIYNEDIIDLLQATKKSEKIKKDLKQDPNKGVFVKDLKMIPVKSVQELFVLLEIGGKNKSQAATAMNATSSRSHTLFTLHIQSIQGKDKIKGSKINLVDLAGSQRQSKTLVTGQQLKQGIKINLSLTALGNVINALVDGNKGGHIPYRDSKLTRLLQDSLGGNTKTLMIASVSPAQDNYDETVSTLRYAARARNIKNTPKINQDPKDAMIREYLNEIQKLKQQLGHNSPNSYNSYNNYNQNNQNPLTKLVQQSEEKEKELHRKQEQLKSMREKLKEMQEIVLKKEQIPPQVLKKRNNKRKKILRQEELVQKNLVQIQNEENKLYEENKEGEEGKSCQYWKNLATKLRVKLRSVMRDKVDLGRQFEIEREDLNKTIRDLEGDLSFYSQLAEKFIGINEIKILKQHSEYDEERRVYALPAFMMHQESVTLPKTLKRYEVDDLWAEKRKNIKMELIPEGCATAGDTPKLKYVEPVGSPFIQTRRIFKIPDYNDPRYQENSKFLRTNFRINDRSQSRERRSNSKSNKLEPLNRPISRSKQELNRPISRSKQEERPSSKLKGKQLLAPINKS